MEENNILYHITSEQAEKLCMYYSKDMAELEEYEICELLDRLIDSIG